MNHWFCEMTEYTVWVDVVCRQLWLVLNFEADLKLLNWFTLILSVVAKRAFEKRTSRKVKSFPLILSSNHEIYGIYLKQTRKQLTLLVTLELLLWSASVSNWGAFK